MAFTLHHIHIKAKDPKASALWWIDMFGGTLLPELRVKTMLFTPVEFDGVRLNITTAGPGEDDVIGDRMQADARKAPQRAGDDRQNDHVS